MARRRQKSVESRDRGAVPDDRIASAKQGWSHLEGRGKRPPLSPGNTN